MTNLENGSIQEKIDWHYFGKRLHAVRGGVTQWNQPQSVCGIWASGYSEDPFNDERHIVVRCKKCSKLLGTEIIPR